METLQLIRAYLTPQEAAGFTKFTVKVIKSLRQFIDRIYSDTMCDMCMAYVQAQLTLSASSALLVAYLMPSKQMY